jgi:hypothetical protein
MKTEVQPAPAKNPTNQEVAKPIVNFGKSLSEKAICIQLEVGRFSSSKKDKRLSVEVANEEHANKEVVSVNKKLMSGPLMKGVINAEQALRKYMYEKTLPWSREGCGVVKITEYLNVKVGLEEKAREFYAAVDALVAEYDNIVNEDKAKLGSMFDQADYPSKEGFKSRFYVKIGVLPIEKTDFRSGSLSNEEVQKINKQIEERLEASVKEAQGESLRRVQEKVAHFLTRLLSDGKLHNSSISNILSTIEEVKSLNIIDNKDLDDILKKVEETISCLSPEMIRENAKARAEAIDHAHSTLAEINKVMDGFGY